MAAPVDRHTEGFGVGPGTAARTVHGFQDDEGLSGRLERPGRAKPGSAGANDGDIDRSTSSHLTFPSPSADAESR